MSSFKISTFLIVVLAVIPVLYGQDIALDENNMDEVMATGTMEPPMSSATHSHPTTAPKHPTPTPTLSKGNYTLKDRDGKICFRAIFETTFKVMYLAKGSSKKIASFDLPPNHAYRGVCSSKMIHFWITWKPAYVLNMTFIEKAVNGTIQPNSEIDEMKENQAWELENIKFTYDTHDNKNFPNAMKPAKSIVYSNATAVFFRTPVNESYTCVSKSVIPMYDMGGMKVMANVTISKAKIQPFAQKYGAEFTCASDLAKNNVVPIAVGAALAGLLLIVIVAYFIGRRNARAGYESV
ncbi:expressed hypothetical protein [Trichoplax adhaerens]|uniref:Lysosome-associated membrane glycoprotein 5 n=1 Tax=Trichoplax adhaerens TaxID=10228 RepID=B3RKY6_TRIAD|nr:expressed hypothetical protein [Trichoplax adhaerens]EDV29457.1 expressed hypothetical protein [Trichoplax adhaerens]|eukprot:XP_002108659.1 expressed hypothetical protein [Trichoplax adhaerens]